MTTQMSPALEAVELLNDLAGQAEDAARAQRDARVAAGTVLSEFDVEGATHRETKHGSGVRLGKTQLPERFEAWDVYGRSSMLPTAQMTYMLTKPHAERRELRAFHLHRGVTRDSCTTCPPSTEPYEGTCQWCLARTAGLIVKAFPDEDARERHERAYHPDEKETLERRLDREMQRAQLKTQQELAEAMIAMARDREPAQAPARKAKTAGDE